MITLNVSGQELQFEEGSSPEEIRKQLRKQSPALYRELVLGQMPNMAQQARARGRQQAAEAEGPAMAARHQMINTALGVGRGARRLFNRMTGDEEEAATLRAQDEENRLYTDALSRAHPVSSFLGKSAPYALAVPSGPMGVVGLGARSAGPAALGIGSATRAIGNKLGIEGAEQVGARIAGSSAADAAAVGAGFGALEDPDDPLSGAFRGAAAGAIGSAIGNRLFARRPTPVADRPDIGRATAAGLAVSPAERYVGSPSVRRLENALETMPYIRSTAGKKMRERNQQTLNKHLRDALDMPTNSPLTSAAMSEVKDMSESAFLAPMRVSRDLRKTLHGIAERQTDITARIQPQSSKIRALLKMINDKGGTDLGPESVRRVMVDLTEAANKSDRNAVRKAYLDAREEFISEFGRQNGSAAENLIRTSLERLGLADAVQKAIRKTASGDESVDYEKILTSFYRNKAAVGPTASPTGFKSILEAAEPFPAHGFGVRGQDLTSPTNFERFLNQGVLSGPLVSGALTGFNPAFVAASGAIPPTLGLSHFSGALPRALDRGVLGALVPGDLGTVPGELASAAGRGAGIGLLEER